LAQGRRAHRSCRTWPLPSSFTAAFGDRGACAIPYQWIRLLGSLIINNLPR
jgi:hypothetical protein